MMMRTFTVFCTIFLVIPIFSAFCATVHVPSEYGTIQEGIDASITGDTVIVASGVYRGDGNRDIEFGGRMITLISEVGPEYTILDIEGTESSEHRGFYIHHNETQDAVIEGFTIRNGWMIHGGAAYTYLADPTFINCRFEDNTSTSQGGAVVIWTSNARFFNCVFAGNHCDEAGGAVHITSTSNPYFSDCIFQDNSSYWGGAFDVNGTCNAVFFNCLLMYNNASAGAGCYLAHGANPVILNCTLVENNSNYGGIHTYNAGTATVRDSILWGNTPEEVYVQSGSSVVITYSNVYQESGVYSGVGNMNQDPLFTGTATWEYRLSHTASGQSSTSPCVDAGSESASEICFESFQGNVCMNQRCTRSDQISDSGTLDMGFHYIPEQVPTATPTAQPTAGPTPTPGCTAHGVEIWMPDTIFSPGEICSCRATVCNTTGSVITDTPLFVVLDVMGSYYFAPDFSDFDNYLDLFPTFAPGATVVQVLPDFAWPSGAGNVNGIRFYGALTNSEVTQLIGNLGSWQFGWTND